MGKKIYGVDLDGEITAIEVRDAIIKCFSEAHCLDTGLQEDIPATKEYCKSIVKKAFDDTSGDFDNPDKEAILNVIEALAEFSSSFRDQDVIKKHMEEIMQLVDKLE